METEEEVDILMSSDVYSATLSTKSITFSRAQTGWLFREDKTVGAQFHRGHSFFTPWWNFGSLLLTGSWKVDEFSVAGNGRQTIDE